MNHFLQARGLTLPVVAELLHSAFRFKQGTHALPTTKRQVCTLFFEASTRTKLSFEAAARQLGWQVTSLALAQSSVTKGESLLDTASTVVALGAQILVVRHAQSGAPHFLAVSALARSGDVHIVNAGDGLNEHPSQALLDAFTLIEQLNPAYFLSGDRRELPLAGRTVAIIGDIRHSRVARSNCVLLPLLGAQVRLFGPPTLVPPTMASTDVSVCRSFFEATGDVDAVMVLRLQLERMQQGYLPSLRDYTLGFGVTRARFEQLRSDVVILHPGPMNRGVEIDDEVADSDRSLIRRQVENGVWARMAVLHSFDDAVPSQKPKRGLTK